MSLVKKLQSHPLLILSLGFFFLNLIIKSLLIHSVPPTTVYDEMYYLAEGKSIAATGTDLTGTWRLWNLAPANAMYSELTGATLAVGFFLFPDDSILAIKGIPILMGSLLPILFGLIVYRLTQARLAFITTVFVATLNPWLFQFSRMGFDSLFSSFFYNLGIVLVLYLKGWKKLWAFLPFFWGFFQYQGHKPLLVPLVCLTLLFLLWEAKKKSILQTVKQPKILSTMVVLLLSVVLTIMYLVRLPTLTSSVRSTEFSLLEQPGIAEMVNGNRLLTLQNPLMSLFDNKYTVVARDMVGRFLASFNIFLAGNELVDTYTVTNYGFMHLADSVLIIAGLVFLWSAKNAKPAAVFASGYVVLGTLPNVLRVGNLWVTFRGALVIFGLILLSGMGLAYILQHKSRRVQALILGAYVFLSLPFWYTYFFQYPVRATRSTYFFEKVVASYIKRNPEIPILIIADYPKAFTESLITNNDLLTPEIAQHLQENITKKEITLNKLTIAESCEDVTNLQNLDPATVVITDFRVDTCTIESLNQHEIEISSPIDSGTKYGVRNDTFCSQYNLPAFIHVTGNKFNVAGLSDQELCQTYFTANKGR